jgi:hypothetical protein
MTRRRAKQSETADDDGPVRVISVYACGTHLGNVNVGRSIRAVRPDRSEIGTFPTVPEAWRTVVRAAAGAFVRRAFGGRSA